LFLLTVFKDFFPFLHPEKLTSEVRRVLCSKEDKAGGTLQSTMCVGFLLEIISQFTTRLGNMRLK